MLSLYAVIRRVQFKTLRMAPASTKSTWHRDFTQFLTNYRRTVETLAISHFLSQSGKGMALHTPGEARLFTEM
jgi:hypothetical protein